MPAVQIRFTRCIQDSQDFGSDDEHMVSRVSFGIIVDGESVGDFTADVKQTVGTDFDTAPLEVSKPASYKGPFDYGGFRRCVEQYYRSLVGTQRRGIRISGATNIRMRNNVFAIAKECGFVADASSKKAW